MTKNSARKRAVREHAAETGKPYLAAARDLDGAARTRDVRKALTIQQVAESVREKHPIPFHINEDGWVARQDYWQGEALFAIGFVTEPKPGTVTVRWSQAWENPEKVIGMYPVLADKFGTWSTWNQPVGETYWIDAAFDDVKGTVHADFGVGEDLVRVDVATMLRSLTEAEIDEIIETGEEIEATHYWWAWVTEANGLGRDRWEGAEDPLTIRLDEDEYRTWEADRH